MTLRPHAAAAAACLAIAGCSPPAPEPTPAPPVARETQQTANPAPVAPASVVTPAYDNWMDAPQTAGDWHYRSGSRESSAAFGPDQSEARFTLRCDRSARTITLVRSGQASGPVPLRIRTETRDRMLTANPAGAQLPTISVTLPATDPILDAMAFSKGRFAIEAAGMPTLYLPSWPEVTRVIEDCR